MPKQKGDIIVAGHICLDLIPGITVEKESLGELLSPGKLLNVGPVVMSTGGAVANTGLGLHKLGCSVRLMGKVGDDDFGRVLLGHLNSIDERLARHMVVDRESNTSYTVVISPPGIDRVFMHCPGANDTYCSSDLNKVSFDGAAIFHFGYPPLMKRLYTDGGAELENIFRGAGKLVTSLDMAMPDPDSEAGRVDWKTILRRVLPHVDIFLPSFDEVAYMLGIEVGEPDVKSLDQIAGWLLDAGVAAAAIKLGSKGLYLRTTNETGRLEKLVDRCGVAMADWRARELWSPCFEVDVVGTTGAGDTTISGFLAELAAGGSPESALTFATAVGACACEESDAASGIRSRRETMDRIKGGWKRCALELDSPDWIYKNDKQVWHGPYDSQRK